MIHKEDSKNRQISISKTADNLKIQEIIIQIIEKIIPIEIMKNLKTVDLLKILEIIIIRKIILIKIMKPIILIIVDILKMRVTIKITKQNGSKISQIAKYPKILIIFEIPTNKSRKANAINVITIKISKIHKKEKAIGSRDNVNIAKN